MLMVFVTAVRAVPQLNPSDITTRRVLTGVHQTLGNTSALPSFRVIAEREFSQGVCEQDNVIQTILCSSRASSRDLKDVLIFPIRRKGEYCM